MKGYGSMKPKKGVAPIGAKGHGSSGANVKTTSLPNGGSATGKKSEKQGL